MLRPPNLGTRGEPTSGLKTKSSPNSSEGGGDGPRPTITATGAPASLTVMEPPRELQQEGAQHQRHHAAAAATGNVSSPRPRRDCSCLCPPGSPRCCKARSSRRPSFPRTPSTGWSSSLSVLDYPSEKALKAALLSAAKKAAPVKSMDDDVDEEEDELNLSKRSWCGRKRPRATAPVSANPRSGFIPGGRVEGSEASFASSEGGGRRRPLVSSSAESSSSALSSVVVLEPTSTASARTAFPAIDATDNTTFRRGYPGDDEQTASGDDDEGVNDADDESETYGDGDGDGEDNKVVGAALQSGGATSAAASVSVRNKNTGTEETTSSSVDSSTATVPGMEWAKCVYESELPPLESSIPAPPSLPELLQDAVKKRCIGTEGREMAFTFKHPTSEDQQSLDREMKRLLVLKSYLLLLTSKDLEAKRQKSLDRLTAMAARSLKAQESWITLQDLGRSWPLSRYESAISQGSAGVGISDMDIENGDVFCEHVIAAPAQTAAASAACWQGQVEFLSCFVVPDAAQDARFQDHPMVAGSGCEQQGSSDRLHQGGGCVRFYAAAPLLSPEGYKLGCICVVDSSPRPGGLSSEEEETLRDLSGLAVDTLVSHRELHHQREQVDAASHVLASATHDLFTPLTGIQLSISVLDSDPDYNRKLTGQQKECFSALSSCSSAMGRVCIALREKNKVHQHHHIASSSSATTPCPSSLVAQPFAQAVTKAKTSAFSAVPQHQHHHDEVAVRDTHSVGSVASSSSSGEDSHQAASFTTPAVATPSTGTPPSSVAYKKPLFALQPGLSTNSTTTAERRCSIPRLVEQLDQALRSTPKKVPLALQVDPAVPKIICANEFGLFRLVMHLLTRACERTRAGSICLSVRVEKREDGKRLRVECVDTGPVLTEQEKKMLLDSEPRKSPAKCSACKRTSSFGRVQGREQGPLACCVTSCFDLVRSEVSALSGDFGLTTLPDEDGGNDGAGLHPRTSFWFSLPFKVPSGKVDDECSIEPKKQAPSYPGQKRLCSEISTSTSQGGAVVGEGPSDVCSKAPFSPESPAKKPNLRLPSLSSPEKRRALVIDDSLVVRKMLMKALSQLGFQSFEARDGLDGLKKMQETRFSIVLLDFLMPKMDGLDCVSQYRRWERNHRARGEQQYIVGMSAHASRKDIDRGLSLGMDDYRSKPITLEVLRGLEAGAEITGIGGDRFESIAFRPKSSSSLRRRDSPTSLRIMEQPGHKVCLIATADRSNCERLQNIALKRGWNSVISHCGTDTLELLKRRNWGAALVDSDLPGLCGLSCISHFREWEKNNRVNRQNNVLLLSNGLEKLKKDSMMLVQLPEGVDGALSKVLTEEDLDDTLKNIDGQQYAFEARDIVLR